MTTKAPWIDPTSVAGQIRAALDDIVCTATTCCRRSRRRARAAPLAGESHAVKAVRAHSGD
jgi:hypothetical protein